MWDGKAGGVDLARLLIEKGADVNAVGKEGGKEGTPLWYAARAVRAGEAGGVDLAKLLIENGADVNAVGKDSDGHVSTPLWWAARAVLAGKAGGAELARLLIEKGAEGGQAVGGQFLDPLRVTGEDVVA